MAASYPPPPTSTSPVGYSRFSPTLVPSSSSHHHPPPSHSTAHQRPAAAHRLSSSIAPTSPTAAADATNTAPASTYYPASPAGSPPPPPFPAAGPSLMLWDMRPEPDDDLHDPDAKNRSSFSGVDLRGLLNVIAVALVLLGILMLFAGYPLLDHYLHDHKMPLQLNSSGQVGSLPSLRAMVDPDTPQQAYNWASQMDGTEYKLVFSDEFEQEGRTFWPGDDPFWEAVDIYYGATNDYEWYSPEGANTTDGALQLTLIEKDTHNLNFQSGMVQSWNKLCFQGGYLEMAVMLPGTQETRGYWPGLWTMGNLGRPGYLGSTDGMWPYSYDTCDWGTLKNQTNPEGTAPRKALHADGPYSYQYQNRLSYLPGQRTSACTCEGEDHPGPDHTIGRSAPEVDIVEAQNTNKIGEASQSLQVAPYDADYWWHNQSATFWNGSHANSYTGSVYQEAVSGVATIPSYAYIDADNARYTTFGLEVVPDWDHNGQGSLTWYIDGRRTWHAPASVVDANPITNISRRIIPTEPMSIVMNLGLSSGFQAIYFDEIRFPARMRVDYVRLYQKASEEPKLSCDPPDHPTAKYINDHADLYFNPNHSDFPKEMFKWPKNRLIDSCT